MMITLDKIMCRYYRPLKHVHLQKVKKYQLKLVLGKILIWDGFQLTYTYDDDTVTKIKKLRTYAVDQISWMTGITHNCGLRLPNLEF